MPKVKGEEDGLVYTPDDKVRARVGVRANPSPNLTLTAQVLHPSPTLTLTLSAQVLHPLLESASLPSARKEPSADQPTAVS